MTTQVRVFSLVTMLAAVVTIAACSDDDSSGPNVPREVFRATLNGANERPTAITTNGTGTAEVVIFGTPGDSISFDVRIGTIDSVRLSHIHRGDVNTAGPIMFGFPNTVPPTNFAALGPFQAGMITRASATSGTFSGAFTFDSLLTHMRAGTAYVNVHTVRNGGGEIRGNLVKQ